jgi:hypothetical protein
MIPEMKELIEKYQVSILRVTNSDIKFSDIKFLDKKFSDKKFSANFLRKDWDLILT